LFGGAADIAPLGIEDHRDAGVIRVDMRDQLLKLVLGAIRCKVGDLRLERRYVRRSRIDDLTAELEDRIRPIGKMSGKTLGLRVETDTQQRI
jgi:hypothetical protein